MFNTKFFKFVATLLVALLTVFLAASCEDVAESESSTVTSTVSAEDVISHPDENTYVIVANGDYLKIVENKTFLIAFMEKLKADNAFDYMMEGTMLTAIGDKANNNTTSSYWMLYCDDEELSNTEWGTYEYNGKTLGSAIVGAEKLPVVEGGTYVWAYCTMSW